MKSSEAQRKGRGMTSDEDVSLIADLSVEEWIGILHGGEPVKRTAAAVCLGSAVGQADGELLAQLSKETCLYTRLAICESLERGGRETARKMAASLGKIGSNQHKKLPARVSAKKSFPLPRDLMARSLGKMDTSVFPVLLEVLEKGKTEQILECLDAVGYLAFYHRELDTEENGRKVISVSDRLGDNPMIQWKLILCLSAFSCWESRSYLSRFAGEASILGEEARRSLHILESRPSDIV